MLGQFLSGIVGFKRERHLIFALNTERGKLAPNSHRTSCMCISISLEMDPDLVSGPNGKQREVMLFFTPEGYTLGQPDWNRAKMYISTAPPPHYSLPPPPSGPMLSISEADIIGLSSLSKWHGVLI